MRTLILLLLSLTLSACASHEQLAAADDALCRGYGATPGSDAYIQCRMQQDSTRRAERQRAIESMSATLEDMQRSLRQSP
jgi:hypothetical protein